MREKGLILRALGTLETHGLRALLEPWDAAVAGLPIQGRICVGKGREALEWLAIVRRSVTPATLGALVVQLRQVEDATGKKALLVAEHVAPPVAERLKDLGHQFMDAAGNAYLDGPGLHFWVVGRRPRTKAARDPIGKAFTKAGLKTLFALITEPALAGAPQRRIAEAADVALGTIPNVLADLEQRGNLAVAGRNRRLIGTKRLLDEWAMAYARTLRPKVPTRRYDAPTIGDWKKWDLAADGCRWGGEPAARQLVDHLVPGVLTIYADRLPIRLVVDRRLKTALGAREAVVEIRRPFWGAPLVADVPRPDVVPTPLVYADLLAVGDARCIETAQLVYEKYLARLFPTI